MNRFRDDLYLTGQTAKHLYETYAKDMPIIDYHCHLIPREIWENKVFEDLGEMWLAHDHYKWRAMRTFGIDEEYITGKASFYEKFKAFAGIMPELIGNPLYIWCALELKRFFGIDEALCAENADEIYKKTKDMIHSKGMCPRMCMEMSNVQVVCTTDDPVDTLEYHTALQQETSFKVRVLPAFRPDKAMYCEKPGFAGYLEALEQAAGMTITCFEDVIAALEKRLQFFRTFGTTVSDCGLEYLSWKESTSEQRDAVLTKARMGHELTKDEIDLYRTAFVTAMGRVYSRNGFVMQLHVGTYKSTNTAMVAKIGVDCGYDCIDDTTSIRSLGTLLDTLEREDNLPKTILYPLNGNEIEPYAVLAAAFCKAPHRGKVQLGAPWWFQDQPYGIQRQFADIANLYPVGLSVGMLTDSRSFLSYPRHELYRRLLCQYLGSLVDRGEYFSGEAALQRVIENVCYNNVKNYFEL